MYLILRSTSIFDIFTSRAWVHIRLIICQGSFSSLSVLLYRANRWFGLYYQQDQQYVFVIMFFFAVKSKARAGSMTRRARAFTFLWFPALNCCCALVRFFAFTCAIITKQYTATHIRAITVFLSHNIDPYVKVTETRWISSRPCDEQDRFKVLKSL